MRERARQREKEWEGRERGAGTKARERGGKRRRWIGPPQGKAPKHQEAPPPKKGGKAHHGTHPARLGTK